MALFSRIRFVLGGFKRPRVEKSQFEFLGHRVTQLGIDHTEVGPLARNAARTIGHELSDHEVRFSEAINDRFLPKELHDGTNELEPDGMFSPIKEEFSAFASRIANRTGKPGHTPGRMEKSMREGINRIIYRFVPVPLTEAKPSRFSANLAKLSNLQPDASGVLMARTWVRTFLKAAHFRKWVEEHTPGTTEPLAVVQGGAHAENFKKMLTDDRFFQEFGKVLVEKIHQWNALDQESDGPKPFNATVKAFERFGFSKNGKNGR